MSALLSIHLSSLSLVTQTKRKWKKHHTHTHTHKRIKQKPREKFHSRLNVPKDGSSSSIKNGKVVFERVRAVRVRVNECACVRVLFFCEPYREKKGERSAWNCEVGKNTEEKRTLQKRTYTKTFFSCLLVLFFFLLLFSFPFSIFSFPPNRLPMPNAQTPNKRQKDTKLKGEKKTQLRKFVCHKIISYVTRIGDWIHFENSQRDDTTIRKDVRITQWPRKTPH